MEETIGRVTMIGSVVFEGFGHIRDSQVSSQVSSQEDSDSENYQNEISDEEEGNSTEGMETSEQIPEKKSNAFGDALNGFKKTVLSKLNKNKEEIPEGVVQA